MRVALISDIHGNAVALEAVYQEIKKESVDAIICLGDVASLGPEPARTIQMVKEIADVTITGNHEIALLEPNRMKEMHIAGPISSNLDWCRSILSDEDFSFLGSFSSTYDMELSDSITLSAYHGTPNSVVGVLEPTSDLEALESQLSGSARIFAGGHIHLQFLRSWNGAAVMNPGSLGCPFSTTPMPDGSPRALPWAEYATVTARGSNHSIELRRAYFSIEEAIATLSKSDLPMKEWMIGQYRSAAR